MFDNLKNAYILWLKEDPIGEVVNPKINYLPKNQ
ncbi:hypothetical protein FIV31_04725 [Coxiella endosymbiont of Ornithodoros amblus]|nr:hypothetical protein [Coxiella endosymbiont of Ornithodoros amblus]MBW5802785.1 hypothetical protein [Coxiella endosymbiont of Ornithodoros amblus]